MAPVATATKKASAGRIFEEPVFEDQELVRFEDDESEEEESDEAEEDVEMIDDEEEEIGEDEKELERLVFGDKSGFREGLKEAATADPSLRERAEDAEDGTTGLEGLDDADLFFTDVGPGGAPHGSDDESDTENAQHKKIAAWDDSDDERMLVSLANTPRLRKLRRTEVEDVINGKEYSKRLRKQFEVLNPVPEWALRVSEKPANKRRRLSQTNGDDDEDNSDAEMEYDDETPSVAPLSRLLQDAAGLVRSSGTSGGKKRKLRPEVIDIQRQKDIPGIQPSAITSLSFHPNLPLLLSSGPSSTVYLHQLVTSPPAPAPNPLLTSLHVRGSQLTTTAFHPTDSRIFLSARRRYFHIWDLASGKVEKISRTYGHQHEQKSMERFKLSPDGRHLALVGSSKGGTGVINVLDATTLQWVAQARIESRGGVAEFVWWRDSTGMCIAGKNGEVTEWSLSTQQVVARWQDEGAVGTTTIALGGQHDLVRSEIGTDRWIAIGSSSGIVNIYDRRVWLEASKSSGSIPTQPKPTKTLGHLTTPTSNLVFSPDASILAMSSRWKRDAMRLVHLPSCTVFKNWPTSSTPLGRITGVAFADGNLIEGGDVHSVLAVAIEQGKIRLWEIR